MNEKIVKIKVNGIALIALSYIPNSKSFMLTLPKMSPPDGSYLENHLSFHTINNRITNKITNAGDREVNFDLFKKEADKNGMYVTNTDIDLLRKMHLNEDDLANSLSHWSYFAYNFLQDDFLQKTICKTKTSDDKFTKVINLKTSDALPAIYIAFYISKNLKVDPETLIHKVAKDPIDEKFFIVNKQGNDVYTFSILVKLADKFVAR